MIECVAARNAIARPRLAGFLRRLGVEVNGATTIEFGLVALPFLAIILAIFELAFLFMTGQALDTSLDQAARELLTGQARSGSNAINSMATFMQYALCPKLPAIVDCSQVQVNVAPISSFTQANLAAPISNNQLNTAGWGFQRCDSNQIMKIEAVYPVPALTSFWTSAYTVTIGGVPRRVLYFSSVFRCEPF